MLDETIITEMPPLYSCYGRRGEQVAVPITGNHARRVLHGALNIRSGDVLLFVTEAWDQATHQAFLTMIRAHWRGWHIVLFEDRGSPHTAAASRRLAQALHIALRFLPTATPELNKTYLGKIQRITDFGAFVEIMPGTDGLLHVSEIANHRVKDVRDELKEGEQILVKVINIDPTGKIRLSRKALLQEEGAAAGGQKQERT